MLRGRTSRIAIVGLVIVVILISVTLLYVMYSTPPTPRQPVTLIVGWVFLIDTLDPGTQSSTDSVTMAINCYDRLVEYDTAEPTKYYPGLAESWETSSDGRVWTFHLRKDVKFWSGYPFNATAVKYSFERVFKTNVGMSYVLTGIMDWPDGLKVLDDYTIQITIKSLGLDLLAALSFPTASILDPTVVTQHDTGDYGQGWLTDHAAGSGPFILTEYIRDVQAVLIKNENYWRGPAKLDKLIFKNVKDVSDRKMMVERGDVDITCGLLPEQISALKALPNIKTLAPVAGGSQVYLAFNTRVKPLDDPQVRKAIRYAIDYKGIIELTGGYGLQLNGIIPKGAFAYDPNLKIERDIAKAKELLKEAGYPNGFSVEITYPFDVAVIPTETLATKLQSDLAEAGIKVTLVGLPWASHLEKIRAWKHQIYLHIWYPDYLDSLACWIAPHFGDPETVGYIERRTGYNNTDLFSLVDEASNTADPDARLSLLQEIQRFNFEETLYINLYQYGVVYALNVDIEGFVAPFSPSPSYYTVYRKSAQG